MNTRPTLLKYETTGMRHAQEQKAMTVPLSATYQPSLAQGRAEAAQTSENVGDVATFGPYATVKPSLAHGQADDAYVPSEPPVRAPVQQYPHRKPQA